MEFPGKGLAFAKTLVGKCILGLGNWEQFGMVGEKESMEQDWYKVQVEQAGKNCQRLTGKKFNGLVRQVMGKGLKICKEAGWD